MRIREIHSESSLGGDFKSQRVGSIKIEDLNILLIFIGFRSICSEFVLNPKVFLIYFQFIVNMSFGYKLIYYNIYSL